MNVFAACVIPVFLWAILSYLDAFPGFALRLGIWDLVGTASYTLAIALFESLVLVLPLVLLAALLPSRLLRDRFATVGSLIIVISCLWLMYANNQRVDLTEFDLSQDWMVLALYLISLAIPIALAVRFERVGQVVRAMVQRVSVLAYFYVGLACISLLVVLIRNL